MALEPGQLLAFLAIVRTGSLGRAANTLHLTQPALSRLVKQMERQRTTGRELTTAGDALLPYPEHLVEEADLAMDEINIRPGNLMSPPLVQFLQTLQQ